jgi:hypothetical protein
MHEQTMQALLALCSQVAALKSLPRTGWLQRGIVDVESEETARTRRSAPCDGLDTSNLLESDVALVYGDGDVC